MRLIELDSLKERLYGAQNDWLLRELIPKHLFFMGRKCITQRLKEKPLVCDGIR